MSADLWDAVQRVNLRGPMLTCKHAIPEIIRAGGGSIINTGSGLGVAGDVVRVAYAASKAGMYALTMHVATTYGRQGVRCNQVSPGVIMTETAKHMPHAELSSIRETVMTQYIGEPEDVAEAVAYLASEASRYVTGQLIHVDGGITPTRHRCGSPQRSFARARRDLIRISN
jgi:NAD(P)-dependent dehydrogenase (short-subunit alcohol dehydrogenase family)